LKDYPIEENPELTIRSVVNNLMLYQEGWGVGRIKHFAHVQRRVEPQLPPHLRARPAFRFCGLQPFHPPKRHRSGRRHPVHDAQQHVRGKTLRA